MRSQPNLARKLSLEQLEDRTVLSGTVTAQLSGGILTLTGDANANAIKVFQVGATTTVQGISTKIADGAKILGVKSFTGVTDIQISLGGGNDALTLTNTKLSGGLDIVMGAGNDNLQMSNVLVQGTEKLHNDFGIFIDMADAANNNLGDGNDTAMLGKITTTTNGFQILAGPGSDFVGLNAVTVPTSGEGNQLIVETGSGVHDVVTLVNCVAGSAVFDFGNLLNNGSTITPGSNGVLSGAGNKISTQTIDLIGSTARSGDLTGNKI